MSQDAVYDIPFIDGSCLFAEVHCIAPPPTMRGPADEDVSLITASFNMTFSMRLSHFAAKNPIQGLLMRQRPRHWWSFFGYTCSLCQQCILVPCWVNSQESLMRALRHGCHVGAKREHPLWKDYVQQLARECAHQAAIRVVDWMALQGRADSDTKERANLSRAISERVEHEIAAMQQELLQEVEWRRTGEWESA